MSSVMWSLMAAVEPIERSGRGRARPAEVDEDGLGATGIAELDPQLRPVARGDELQLRVDAGVRLQNARAQVGLDLVERLLVVADQQAELARVVVDRVIEKV